MNAWIVLGSAADVPKYYARAKQDYPDAPTIATNHALKMVVPEYYFLNDMWACELFAEQARELQQSHGMKIVTPKRQASALQNRGLHTADFLLECARGKGYAPGGYTDCQFSGLFCLQFALMQGAEAIAAVGHGGYPPNGEESPYWYDPPATTRYRMHATYTHEIIGPFWNAAIEQNPGVAFRFYGGLYWKIKGTPRNVTHTRYDEDQSCERLAANEVGNGCRTA